jgi:putative hydrolase of the HAD superfamily
VLSGFAAAGAWLREQRGIPGFAEEAERVFLGGQRKKVFDTALESLGLVPDSALVQALVGVYRTHAPSIQLFPDADEVLEWAGREFKLGLITDGWLETQRNKVAALGLERRISCRVLSDELGAASWKPSPEPYRKVMAFYGGEPEGFVYVGDNPAKDFVGARALGWRTVRVRRLEGEHFSMGATPESRAEYDIADLRELTRIIVPS